MLCIHEKDAVESVCSEKRTAAVLTTYVFLRVNCYLILNKRLSEELRIMVRVLWATQCTIHMCLLIAKHLSEHETMPNSTGNHAMFEISDTIEIDLSSFRSGHYPTCIF